MELYLLRHAIAVERGTRGFDDDSRRPLSDEGKRKMERIAEGMQSLGLTFDLILSSPFMRARQTAEIVARTFGLEKKLKFSEALEAGGDAQKLVSEIHSTYAGLKSIVLVGHEPYLSGLISVLCVGDSSLQLTMKKGGLCKLTVGSLSYGRCATLEWLLAPSHMRGLQ